LKTLRVEVKKIYDLTKESLKKEKLPDVEVEEVKVKSRPRGLLGKVFERDYLMVTNKGLKDFKMYIGARDRSIDRAINQLGGGGKPSKAVALEVIKEWLEPEGYKVTKEKEIETDLTESHRGYTDLVAEKDGKTLRIEIEHRSPKEQVEKNIRKNLDYSDTLYIITSDETAKKKVIQVALKTMFRLRKDKPDKTLTVKIGSINEQRNNGFKRWFEVRNR